MEAARKAADKEQPRKVAKIKPRLYKFMVSESVDSDDQRQHRPTFLLATLLFFSFLLKFKIKCFLQ
jgi:hypothetical protein